jgi:hypothetical protein
MDQEDICAVASSESHCVWNKGPLKEGEIKRTKDYARELIIKLKKEKA